MPCWSLAMIPRRVTAPSTLRTILDSKLANLTRMVATLEALPPKVVRMRALDAQAMDALSGTMNDELERINGDIKAFEETLQSLGESITA